MKSKVMTLTLAALLCTTAIGTTTAFAETNTKTAAKNMCIGTTISTKNITINGIKVDMSFRNNILLWFLFGGCQNPIVTLPPSNGDNGSVNTPSDDEAVPPSNEGVTTPDNGNAEIPNDNVSSGNGSIENGNSNLGNTDEIVPPSDSSDVVQPEGNGNANDSSQDQVQKPSEQDKPVQQAPSVGENAVNDKFMAEVEQEIFNIVNQERANAGLSKLSYNTTMENYARIKSQDMGDNNYFSHEDLNGNLITEKMSQDGVTYRSWGENIAYIGGSSLDAKALAQKFMTNWMNSSGHRANILSTNFESIGVGVYKIGNKVYATQEFYR